MATHSMKALVKSVFSGDTIVLRGRPKNNAPPPERQLSLNFIVAPRMGNATNPSEPFAFESREFLRRKLVGKEVSFAVQYTSPSGREYGVLTLEGVDIGQLCVTEGWCSLRDDAKFTEDDTDFILELNRLQTAAKNEEKGIWSKKDHSDLNLTFPEEPRDLLNLYKGKLLDGIIEQVRDGSNLKMSIVIPEESSETVKKYQSIILNISGIKCPTIRKGINGQEDVVEPFAEEAKYYVESRLLQKDLQVILEGINNNVLCGTIRFPAGNIAESLVAAGLAKVADWGIAVLTDGPAKLRAAERAAKENRLRLWKDRAVQSKPNVRETKFDATVLRIITADSISVEKSDGSELKVHFSSLRAPKIKDAKEGYYANEAKEYLRKTLIGKLVKVNIDYIRPQSEGFEERTCVTITFNDSNVAENLIKKGLAFIIHHKKDDENRSTCYDDLLIASEEAKAANVGVHSNKATPPIRIVDASESLIKAKQFYSFFQRSGKLPGVVEYVTSGSRVKVFIPSQNCIQVPRNARNPQEAGEPYGEEAYSYVLKHVMQRDVEVEIEGTDKNGAFIGSLFVNRNFNVAVKLLENGFATVQDFSGGANASLNQLYAAESVAKNKNLNIWTTISKVEETTQEDDLDKAKEFKSEKVKLVFSDLPGGPKFAVQIIDNQIHELEKLMGAFSLHHSTPSAAAETSTFKTGQLCSAKSEIYKQWYRAKVKKVIGGKSAEVLFLDFGNIETISVKNLRSLPEKFSVTKLKPQAVEAKLAYLRVPEFTEDYGSEAFDLFKSLVEGREFNATIEARIQNVAHLVLYTDSKFDISRSVNYELVKAGYGILLKPKQLTGPLQFRDKHIKILTAAQSSAKKGHYGMWEFGEVVDPDDNPDY